MGRLPWVKFSPADYLIDTAPLSPSARGLWMDILCLMWRAESGTLSYPLASWGQILRTVTSDLTVTLTELLHFQVCDIETENGNALVTLTGNAVVTIINRRLQREYSTKESTRLRVQRHRVTRAVTPPVTAPVTPLDTGESRVDKTREVKRNGNAVQNVTDTDWLHSLRTNPAYLGLNVDIELAKCQAWLSAKYPRKTLSRTRFVNWLNRAEQPMTLPPTPTRHTRNLQTLADPNPPTPRTPPPKPEPDPNPKLVGPPVT